MECPRVASVFDFKILLHFFHNSLDYCRCLTLESIVAWTDSEHVLVLAYFHWAKIPNPFMRIIMGIVTITDNLLVILHSATRTMSEIHATFQILWI